MMWNPCQADAGGIAGFAAGVAALSASVFTVCALLPDELIEPKWYAACLVAMAGGTLLAALCLARPGGHALLPPRPLDGSVALRSYIRDVQCGGRGRRHGHCRCSCPGDTGQAGESAIARDAGNDRGCKAQGGRTPALSQMLVTRTVLFRERSPALGWRSACRRRLGDVPWRSLGRALCPPRP